MEYFEHLFDTWGYLIVFIGAIIEGESIIIPACIFSYLGYLSITKVMLIAFTGTLIADQSLYYVGRYYGRSILDRFPRFQKPARRAFKLLHQWDYKFILSFRFIYGIRMISPVVVGAAHYPAKRYAVLNLIAAVVWTIGSCSLGYFLGSVIEVIGYVVVEKYLFRFSIALLFLVLIAGYFTWKKLYGNHDDDNEEDHENHPVLPLNEGYPKDYPLDYKELPPHDKP